MFDDGWRTTTTKAQHGLEKKLSEKRKAFWEATAEERERELTLKRDAHVEYLRKHIGTLPEAFTVLDASQSWVLYWILHGLAVLDEPLPGNEVVEFLRGCQVETGGFGGGPNQMPHLAATYAAVMCLVTIGTPEALDVIDRKKLESFVLSVCIPPEKGGGLTVHEGGECDLRACYSAIAVAHVLCLDKHKIAESCGIVSFIKQCQAAEGGLGGEPGNEAHGGYTFCGVAALCLLDKLDVLNIAALLRWVAHMQGPMEGGFMGRTHKLVDGCYSYWQGAIFLLLKPVFAERPDLWTDLASPSLHHSDSLSDIPMYETEVSEYSAHEEVKDWGEQTLRQRAKELGLDFKQALNSILQDPSSITAYDQRIRLDLFRTTFEECQSKLQATDDAFSEMFPIGSKERTDLPSHVVEPENQEQLYDAIGLQFWVLLHCQIEDGGLRDKPNKTADLYHTCYCLSGLAAAQQYSGTILGPESNRLIPIDPVLNVVQKKSDAALKYFSQLD